MQPDIDRALTALATAARDLGGTPLPDEDIPDAAGRCRKIETDLANWRRGLTSELPAGTHVGGEYQVTVPRVSHRSYNTPAIIASVADRSEGMFTAIRLLQDADALRLEWMWSNLEKCFADHGWELHIASGRELRPEEMGDLDAPHVGVYWTEGTPRVEAAGKEPFRRGKR